VNRRQFVILLGRASPWPFRSGGRRYR